MIRRLFILFAAGVLVSIAIYPEVFLTFKASFVTWYDYCVEYVLSFVLTNFFYQGGIQLWDHFGQMPNAYTFVTFGLFKFQNVMTALLYVLLHPMTDNSAELYHQVFAWGNLFAHLFLRLSGIFLLLSCVTDNKRLLMGATFIGALFYSQPAFLWGTFYMSLIPLGAYFIVRFFQCFQWRYWVGLMLFMIICLGSGIIHTGYLNVGLHFIFISALGWSFIFNRQGWAGFGRRLTDIKTGELAKLAGMMGIAALLIVGPYAYMIKNCLNAVAFGAETSRISHMFDPYFYFHQLELSLCPPQLFFKDTLNFLGQPSAPVFYIGWIFYVTAFIGLVLSRNRLKWLFFAGIVFIWLINFPRESFNVGHAAHWINFLTNPIKTLARSYYVATETTLPYLLMPLVVLGIEALIELAKGRVYRRREWGLVLIGVAFFTITNMSGLPEGVQGYLKVMLLAFGALVASAVFLKWTRVKFWLVGFIVLLFVSDIGLVIYQSKKDFAMNARKPLIFDAAPQLGTVGHEVQNPVIFPFTQRHTMFFSFADEVYLWFPRGVSNNMTHMTNQALNFLYINGHSPRSAMYKDWLLDEDMKAYLTKNQQAMFVAQQAVAAGPQTFKEIVEEGLVNDVVMLDDPKHQLQLPARWPASLKAAAEPPLEVKVISGTVSQIATPDYYHLQGDMAVFSVPLPSDFPKHVASSWFSENREYLHFYIQFSQDQWRELQQAQGELIKAYTYDVNNIREGVLTVAFPRDGFSSGQRFVFQYPSSNNPGLIRVWQGQYDNFGFDYRASRSGWLVYQQPYDPHWEISVDGKKTAYYRANKSFLAFPISAGEHRILVRYWPGSLLRPWLLVSAVLTNIGLLVLIMAALIWERKNAVYGKHR